MAHDPGSPEALLAQDAWLRALALRLARDAHEADELVQETWLRVLRRPEGSRGWLRRVLENVGRERGRSEARRRDREARVADERAEGTVEPPDAIAARVEARRSLLDAIEALPEPQRTAVVLRYLEGLAVRDVARRTQVPFETAKRRVARGLELLREHLARDGARGRAGGAHWLAGLAPLLAFTDPTPTLAVLGMKTKTKLALVLGVLLLGATAVVRPWQAGAREVEVDVAASELERASSLGVGTNAEVQVVDVEEPDREALMPVVEPAEVESAEPMRLVEGRVVDLAARPVEGAAVHALEGEAVDDVTTDAEGRFAWPVGDRAALVAAEVPGQVCVLRAWARPQGRGAVTVVMAPTRRYAGRVIDAAGAPVVEADLRFDLPDAWARHIVDDLSGGTPAEFRTRTDFAGAFELPPCPAVGGAAAWLRVGERNAFYGLPDRDALDLVLTLEDPESEDERWEGIEHVSGRVLGPDGVGVEGAVLLTSDYRRTSGEHGTFRFPRSQLEPGTELVVAHGTNFARVRHEVWPDHLEVRLEGDLVDDLVGRMVDHEGAPVARGRVWIHDPSELSAGRHPDYVEELFGDLATRTDEDGAFRFPALVDRTYELRAFGPRERRRASVTGVRPGGPRVELVLEVEREPGPVEGRVVAPDGTPIADVEVTPIWTVPAGSTESWNDEGSATTDADGRFRFASLPPAFNGVELEGPSIVGGRGAVGVPGEPLELVARRRVGLRVDAAGHAEEATHFTLAPEGGGPIEPLFVYQWILEGTFEGCNVTHWGELEEGRSRTYVVGEGRGRLLLYAHETLLAEHPVDLRPGPVRTIRID